MRARSYVQGLGFRHFGSRGSGAALLVLNGHCSHGSEFVHARRYYTSRFELSVGAEVPSIGRGVWAAP